MSVHDRGLRARSGSSRRQTGRLASPKKPPARGAVRRRRATAVGIAIALGAFGILIFSYTGGSGGTATPAQSAQTLERVLRLKLHGRRIAEMPTSRLGQLRSRVALANKAPAAGVLTIGRAKIHWRTKREELVRSISRVVAAGGGTIAIPQEPYASSIRLPVIKQTLQDDCEATSLSMMLNFAGKQVDQITLQDQVARSGPLDPEQGPNGEVWGDPSRGFVGNASGGGAAGGFGVYQGPIDALARRHGDPLYDLSGKRPEEVYRTLLSGRPVMVWVALSEGPYASWYSPGGKVIRVNYGEHAVVLSGTSEASVTVNDPLSGQRLIWSKSQFESMWNALGRRALAA